MDIDDPLGFCDIESFRDGAESHTFLLEHGPHAAIKDGELILQEVLNGHVVLLVDFIILHRAIRVTSDVRCSAVCSSLAREILRGVRVRVS